jgi:hypothetical protein
MGCIHIQLPVVSILITKMMLENPVKGVMEAQAGNMKMADRSQEKGLEAHPDKTCFIVFGSKNYKSKINEELKANPLKRGTFSVNQKQSDRYLGQILHSDGVQASNYSRS